MSHRNRFVVFNNEGEKSGSGDQGQKASSGTSPTASAPPQVATEPDSKGKESVIATA